ncbi:MAG: hypothetical protein HKO62_03615 [Gammaproteobacteria bacterium]|nr:hypothetical protein [Gammaproteobacteria bacterium]NNL99814.1 hypothetical protein [Gammaproteobacteria bacterium]
MNRYFNYSRRLYQEAHLVSRTFGRQLIIADGMPRSGSTLMYNAIRIALEARSPSVSCGWVGDASRMKAADYNVVKLHFADFLMRWRADLVFYSYRDVRDAMVSAERKFAIAPSVERARKMIRKDMRARKRADHVFSFERLTDDVEGVAAEIIQAVASPIGVAELVGKLPSKSLSSQAEAVDQNTQMHGGHATGVGKGDWRNEIDARVTDAVNREFGWWFELNGYPLS